MTIITINLSLSILLMVLLPLLNRDFLLKNLNDRQLAVCCIAVMIRALIPLEFPFSRTILISEILPSIRDFMKHPFTLGTFSVKVSQLVFFFWVLIALIMILRKFRLYFHMQKIIRSLPDCKDKVILKTMQSLTEKYPSAKYVRVVTADLNISPLVTGIKHPVILLPEYSFSPAEYRMILEHEILHCIRHDILIKFTADILCSVYWWNPLFFLLRKKIFELIELGNDRHLTAFFSSDEKAAYMQCLTDIAKKICSYSVPFTLSFHYHEGKVLRRRIRLIGSFGKSRRIRDGFVVGILLLFLWFSTSFTFEPYAMPEDSSYITLNKDNCYIIQNNELSDIYYQNELFLTTDSIEYLNPDIPIFQSKGDESYEQKEIY